VGLLTTGKNENREKYGGIPQTHHIIPVVNLPVTDLSILKLQKLQKLQKFTEI
jgi:hypothetical protein